MTRMESYIAHQEGRISLEEHLANVRSKKPEDREVSLRNHERLQRAIKSLKK